MHPVLKNLSFSFQQFQLKRSVIDHVSDSFLETNVPLVMLMDAAKSGDEDHFEVKAVGFKIHAEKLQEVKLQTLFEGSYLVFIVISILGSLYQQNLSTQLFAEHSFQYFS